MIEPITLLYTNLALAMFYIFYRAFCARSCGPQTTRAFLLGSLCLSLFIPIIGRTVLQNLTSVEVPLAISEQMISAQELFRTATKPSSHVSDLVLMIYFGISSILFLRMMVGLGYILKLRSKSTLVFHELHAYYQHEEIDRPFSFFGMIFLPTTQLNEQEKRSILLHEMIHGLQLHSIDRVLIEILVCLFWINPFVWKIRKELEQVHEFLADKGVLYCGVNAKDYQQLLVFETINSQKLALTSNFEPTLIKQRIMKMKMPLPESSKRLLGLLPVVAIMMCLMFACDSTEELQENINKTEEEEGNVDTQNIFNNATLMLNGVEVENLNDLDPGDVSSISVTRSPNSDNGGKNILNILTHEYLKKHPEVVGLKQYNYKKSKDVN